VPVVPPLVLVAHRELLVLLLELGHSALHGLGVANVVPQLSRVTCSETRDEAKQNRTRFEVKCEIDRIRKAHMRD
jgi:hypothetical protein